MFMVFLMVACGTSDEPDAPDTPGTPDQPVAPDDPSRPDDPDDPSAQSRTVLVYMVADNSLGYYDFDESDLEEMQLAVADGVLGDGGRLLVYYNRPGTDSGNAPMLLEFTSGGRVTLKDYADDPSIYSTDAGRMTQVIGDVRAYAPARQYGLVLWSHASAWLEEGGSRNGAVDGGLMQRSFGNDRGRKMKITSLATALEGIDLEFIYFDCCLMASVEAAYELRHVTPWIVATTTELPADGTNYRLSLPCMFAPGEPDVKGIASATFDYYAGMNSTCTMSVIDTSKLDALAAASRRVMECAPSNGKEAGAYQRFSSKGSYKPLVDMADYYEAFTGVDEEIMASWRVALGEAVAYEAATPVAIGGVRIDTHCGLSTLFISDPAETDYMGYESQAWWADVVSHNPDYR